MRHRTSRGFTLVELMVTVAVVAILSAIAFPSFQSTLRSNRLATAANELTATVSLARSEAIRNPGGAAVCASSSGTLCDGASWNDGWVVYIDLNNSASLDAADRVLRFFQPKNQLTITGTANAIAFDNRGRNMGAAQTITLRSATCPGAEQLVRTVSVSVTGQTKITKGTCS